MMNPRVVKDLVASLCLMKYFPTDSGARVALIGLMGDLTEDENAVRWLVKKLRTDYAEWPGEQEVRRVFCEKYRPKDGVVVCRYSGGAEGCYSHTLKPNQVWPPVERAMLPAGGPISKDRQICAAIEELAESKRLPAPKEPMPLQIPAPRIAETREQKHFKPITQADVEEAERMVRKAKRDQIEQFAHGELGEK